MTNIKGRTKPVRSGTNTMLLFKMTEIILYSNKYGILYIFVSLPAILGYYRGKKQYIIIFRLVIYY